MLVDEIYGCSLPQLKLQSIWDSMQATDDFEWWSLWWWNIYISRAIYFIIAAVHFNRFSLTGTIIIKWSISSYFRFWFKIKVVGCRIWPQYSSEFWNWAPASQQANAASYKSESIPRFRSMRENCEGHSSSSSFNPLNFKRYENIFKFPVFCKLWVWFLFFFFFFFF